MKRLIQVIFFGLILSISSVALAGHGNDRNNHDAYYGGQHRDTHHYDRYDDRHHGRHGHRHHGKGHRNARRHSHHGRYCHDWHPHGYVAPRVHYGYRSPGLVIVYQPNSGLYIESGH